jgi:hypothetical protein
VRRLEAVGRCFVAVAMALAFGCAHRPATQAPKQEGAEGIIVSAEFIKGAGTQAIAAWILYASTRKALFDAVEPGAGYRKKAADDYTIEVLARSALIRHWRDFRKDKATPADAYLDSQVAIDDAGFVEEYALSYLSRPGWTVPAGSFASLDWPAYRTWAGKHLQGHVAQRHATFVPKADQTVPPPGGDLPDLEALLPTRRPCAETNAVFAATVAAWSKEEAGLHGAPLAAGSREELVRSLEWAAGQPEVRARGVTWVVPAVADLHFLAGFCANDRQDWTEAIRLLHKTATLKPLDPKLRGELVHALTSLRQFDEADREIEAALALRPGRCTEARLLRSRGYALVERRKVVEAYRTYVRSLELDPTSDLARQELKLIVGMLQTAGSSDAKALSEVPLSGISTTTTGSCREE